MKIFRKLGKIGIICAGGLIVGISGTLFSFYNSVELSELNLELEQSSLIFDSKGVLLDEVHGEEHRKTVNLDNIDKDIQKAVIAIEDGSFYDHKGISWRGVVRAAVKNVKTKSRSEGASTITMQLTKNLIGTVEERNWFNKLRETFLALKLEQHLSKDEILELYLNTIYWGNNTYGIETATETYFGKQAKDISISEASVLAAMIQNPNKFNIYNNNNNEKAYAALKSRQKTVLKNMSYSYSNCKTSKKTAESIKNYNKCLNNWVTDQYNKPLKFSGKRTWQVSINGYITDLAIQEVIESIDGINSIKDIEKGGYKIYSSINKKVQDIGIKVVNRYRVKGQQIALGAVDPKTNLVITSVGGYNYNESPLNRTSSNGGLRGRQPGSSQKPYVYYQAFVQGYEPSSIINNKSIYSMGWGVPNYVVKGADDESDTLNNHLKWSRNGAAVNLGRKVGINNVISTMKDLGISTKLENVTSFPLGSNNVILLEHVNAYAAFANEGYQTKLSSLLKVEDKEGNIILDNSNRRQYKKLNKSAVKKLNLVLRNTAIGGTAKATNTISGVHAIT